MPDHVHLLVGGTTCDSDLVRWISIGKQYFCDRLSTFDGQELWQEGWLRPRRCESDDGTAIIRYVIENPIRAAIVEDVRHFAIAGDPVSIHESDLLQSLERRT